MTTLLAHLGDHGPQLLENHLNEVAGSTRQAAEKLGLPLAGELIGLLHDLGKASDEFQGYLRSFDPESGLKPRHDLRGKIDHSTAGAQRLWQGLVEPSDQAVLRRFIARVLALCVLSHHGGLIDCLEPTGQDKLHKRLRKDESAAHGTEAWANISSALRDRVSKLIQDPELTRQCLNVLKRLSDPKRTFGDREVQLGLFVRLLFSCLIDADRTNTADHENRAGARHRQHRQYTPWETLLARLESGVANLATESRVNTIRRRISDECFAAAARVPGIYTLTVPTGGGKTLAALRFALEHARRNNMERVVFVSPYISIVDQNADVARRYLEPEGTEYATVVLEHHSDLTRDRERGAEPDVDGWRRRVLAENWDAPVVFTTMVQVLEALFGAGTTSVRRLQALAGAVLVFDEVQTLPVKMVHLFNNSINLLTAHCGSTVLLCTATQPLLQCVDQARGAAALAPVPDLIEKVGDLFEALHRYTVLDHTDKPGGWTRERAAALVCEEAQAYGGCLLVVNTKRDAREIFQLCRKHFEDAGAAATVIHLSTGMCPVHRAEALDTVKRSLLERGVNSPPVVCVSTQLIEAGVDIDFPCVVRDLAGLDSIAQAAGRCNRHGSRPQPGRVHIIELPEPGDKLDDIRKGREVAREQLGQWRRQHPGEPFPLDRPEQMQQYYAASFFRRKQEMVFALEAKRAKGLNRDTSLLDLLGSNALAVEDARRVGTPPDREYLLQSFHTAGENFELILPTQGIVVPFRDKGKEVVAELNSVYDVGVEWQLLRKAQQYTISVFESQFRILLASGAVYPVESGTGVYCLRPEFYDEHFGLRTEAGFMEAQLV